jgi:hypothetical protein
MRRLLISTAVCVAFAMWPSAAFSGQTIGASVTSGLPGFYTVSLSVPAGWNGWCSGSGTDNNGEHPNLFYFASPSWEDYYATWFDNHLTAVSDPLTSC